MNAWDGVGVPIEIQRAPAPVTEVIYRRSDGREILRSHRCEKCLSEQFDVVVHGKESGLRCIPRDELRQWCAAVIEMLDQDAP